MYETYFGLTDKPFKLSPDPRYFFESPHHKKAVSYLKYGLSQGEGFIVITGPIGTGKTTIAKNILSSLDENVTAIQLVTTKLSPEELVRSVASGFGIDISGLMKSDVLKKVEDHLLWLHNIGKRAVLIIDEAQNLPAETVEELRMLSNFQKDDKPLLQSFLLGQEELQLIIRKPELEQFRQRIIASCHLRPLKGEEVQNYIEHRLTRTGWNSNPKIGEAIYPIIEKHTGGIPRKINIFMDRVLLYACLNNLSVIEESGLNEVIEEMSLEISGDLQLNETKVVFPSANDPVNGEEFNQVDDMKRTLAEVSDILKKVIKTKSKMVNNLDKLISDKKKLLAKGIDKEGDNQLKERSWVKLLMKEHSDVG